MKMHGTIKDDPARWFDPVGMCSRCGKPAHGKLMGFRNENLGAYCARCANARLERADKAREKAEKKQ